MTPLYILLGLTFATALYISWRMNARMHADVADPHAAKELARRDQEIGELRSQIDQLKTEKTELATKGKQQFSTFKDLEGEYKGLRKERDALSSRVAKYEAEEERRQQKHEELIGKQESARAALEDEKLRVRKDDEARQARELAERDRLWNEHEQHVQAVLRDLCRQPQYAFRSFENDKLPDDFDGSLAPDFLIEFLDQYVLFDAKVSRSQDIQTYITNAVKTTAKKVKGNPKIYPTVFLVIPTEAIGQLKKLQYLELGFTFFVVSPESLGPILACFKKITMYELADQFDPQEREGIIDWIAKLDFHINTRNTFDILMAEMGAELLKDSQRLHPELAKDVEQRKDKMKMPAFKASDMKRLVSSILARQEKISDLSAPKPSIERRVIETGTLGL